MGWPVHLWSWRIWPKGTSGWHLGNFFLMNALDWCIDSICHRSFINCTWQFFLWSDWPKPGPSLELCWVEWGSAHRAECKAGPSKYSMNYIAAGKTLKDADNVVQSLLSMQTWYNEVSVFNSASIDTFRWVIFKNISSSFFINDDHQLFLQFFNTATFFAVFHLRRVIIRKLCGLRPIVWAVELSTTG